MVDMIKEMNYQKKFILSLDCRYRRIGVEVSTVTILISELYDQGQKRLYILLKFTSRYLVDYVSASGLPYIREKNLWLSEEP